MELKYTSHFEGDFIRLDITHYIAAINNFMLILVIRTMLWVIGVKPSVIIRSILELITVCLQIIRASFLVELMLDQSLMVKFEAAKPVMHLNFQRNQSIQASQDPQSYLLRSSQLQECHQLRLKPQYLPHQKLS